MRGAVVFTGNRQLEIRSFPDPSPGPGEAVVQIRASGLCGSDLHAYRGPERAADDQWSRTMRGNRRAWRRSTGGPEARRPRDGAPLRRLWFVRDSAPWVSSRPCPNGR